MQSKLLGVVTFALSLWSQVAAAQYQQHPTVEAECPDTSSGSYGTVLTDHGGFSGVGHLRSNGNTTASQFDGTSSDLATYEIEIKNGGTYALYFRVNTNGSGGDDSFYYRMPDVYSGWTTMNGLSSHGTGWHWVEGSAWYPIGGGTTYTIEIANRENGFNIDKIALLPVGSPVPTGQGDPAYNCPTSYYFEAECRDQADNAYQVELTARGGFSGEGYLESEHNNGNNPALSDDRAFYEFQSGAANYSFYFRVHTNGSFDDDSWFYRVDSGGWTQMNGAASLGSGWNWAQGSASANLAQGTHTLEVANREDGLAIDKIAFIPSGSSGPSGQGGVGVNCEPFDLMSDWPYVETEEYEATHLAYMADEGNFLLSDHTGWHGRNGSGGTAGPGSGVAFLGYHRAVQNRFERFAIETGGRAAIPVDIDSTIPTFGDAEQPLIAAGFEAQYIPRSSYSLVNLGIPPYLTLTGVGFGSRSWDDPITIDSVDYDSIGDFPDLDTLGRAIGAQYHASAHVDIGGTMSTFYSPADPVFYGWHGWLDQLVDVWLATSAGQSWAAANPNHPFLNAGFTHLTGWENSDWD